jgi:hypothetical protein
MREIKFRAWDGSCFDYDIAVGRHTKDAKDCKVNTCIQIDDGNCWAYHEPPIAIQQFTGLLDKNGKEIYEGDVFEVTDGDEWVVGDHLAKMDGETLDTDGRCIGKILGNIYENPELVKE